MRSMGIYMASAILESGPRTKLKSGILSPFLPGDLTDYFEGTSRRGA
jgi:hypothetical protein